MIFYVFEILNETFPLLHDKLDVSIAKFFNEYDLFFLNLFSLQSFLFFSYCKEEHKPYE